MSANPYNTYQSLNKENMQPRELEASILTKAGMMLKRCQKNWHDSERDRNLDEALKFNQKVWSFFQAELSDPENPLPLPLRCNILNLSILIDKIIFDVIAYPEPEKLTPIIEINLNLAAGLFTTPEESTLEMAA